MSHETDAPAGRWRAALPALGAGLLLLLVTLPFFRTSPPPVGYVTSGFDFLRACSWPPAASILLPTLGRHLLSLLVFAGIVASAYSLGRALAGRLPDDPLLDRLVVFGTGFAALILAFHVLALTGTLNRATLAAVGIGPLLVAAVRGGLEPRARRAARAAGDAWIALVRTERIALLALGGVVALALPWTLAPPLTYDALLYHLAVPLKYLLAHGPGGQPNQAFSFHPANIGFLLAYGYGLYDIAVSKLLLLLMGFLNAALVVHLVRHLVGSRTIGLLLAASSVCMPYVFMEMTAVWIDVAVAFFATLSLALLLRWLEQGRRSDCLLAGLMAGIALGSKYTAVVDLAALETVLLAGLFLSGPLPRRARLHGFVLFQLLAAAPLLPFLARNWLMTGNPVYPLAHLLFPTPELMDVTRAAAFFSPMQRGNVGFLAFWYEMFYRNRFLECVCGPLPVIGALLVAPSLLLRSATRLARLLALHATAFMAAFYLSRLAVLRYGSSLLLVLLVLTAPLWRMAARGGRAGRMVLASVLLLDLWLLCIGLALNGHETAAPEYALGFFSRTDYLERHLFTSYYRGAEFLNSRRDVDRVLLVGESRAFYHEHDFIVDGPYMERSTLQQLADGSGDARDLAARLRARGVSHIFVNIKEQSRLGNPQLRWSDESLQRYLDFVQRGTRLVYDCRGILIHEVGAPAASAPTEGVLDEPLFYLDHERAEAVYARIRQLGTASPGDPAREQWVRELVALAPRSRDVLLLAAEFHAGRAEADEARELTARAAALVPFLRSDAECGAEAPR